MGSIWLTWTRTHTEQEIHDRYHLKQFTSLAADNHINHEFLSASLEGFKDNGPTQWAALTDPYFLAGFIPLTAANQFRSVREQNLYSLRVGGTGGLVSAKLYVGPKDESSLVAVDPRLSRSIDLGWFTFLAKPLLSAIRFFYTLLGNYGLAVILLTLVIKMIFLPLNMASLKSMKKMQEIQPEIQALKERIKDNPTQLNTELRQLFVKRGVNPVGGCLPIAVQIPVFLGLYNALLNSIDMRHAPFALWIKDLSAPESLHILGMGIPVMLLLMAASMLIQQYTTPTPAMDPVQKRVMLFMPLIFTVMFIVIPMPAGLVLYWLVNNTISIVQQVSMRKFSAKGAVNATLFASITIFFIGFVLTKI